MWIIKAFVDWHDKKKDSLFGSCPAYDIALEASLVENTIQQNRFSGHKLWPSCFETPGSDNNSENGCKATHKFLILELERQENSSLK